MLSKKTIKYNFQRSGERDSKLVWIWYFYTSYIRNLYEYNIILSPVVKKYECLKYNSVCQYNYFLLCIIDRNIIPYLCDKNSLKL